MADMETKAPQPASNNQDGVQLGIGTLIIIAIIVTTCSGKGEVEKIKGDTVQIKQQLAEINKKLDALAPQGSAAAAGDVEAPGPSDPTP